MDKADYKNFYANKFKVHESPSDKIGPIEIREENGVRIEVFAPGRAY